MNDLISRQAAINAVCEHGTDLERRGITILAVSKHKQVTVDLLEALPPVQPTLYGYSIENLALIATLLAKENLPPERVTEALSDIKRVESIIRKEYDDLIKSYGRPVILKGE